MNVIIIMCGTPGVCKTTIEKKVKELNIATPLEIYTTREPREDDPDYYNCVGKGEFNNLLLKNKFCYHFETGDGNFYGYCYPTTSKAIVSFLDEGDCKQLGNTLSSHGYRPIVFEVIADYDINKIYAERKSAIDDIEDRNKKSCGHMKKVDRDKAIEHILNRIQALSILLTNSVYGAYTVPNASEHMLKSKTRKDK